MKIKKRSYDAIVIGASAGGLDALSVILPSLSHDLAVPVIIVLHISPKSDSFLVTYLNQLCKLTVAEATDKTILEPGCIYFAPPDYHVLVDDNLTLSLSNEEKVNFSRPSIDILFETASWVFKSRLVGVLLTGANWDGAYGMEVIHKAGGYTIIQDPKHAAVPRMPESVLVRFKPNDVLLVEEIGPKLNSLGI